MSARKKTDVYAYIMTAAVFSIITYRSKSRSSPGYKLYNM